MPVPEVLESTPVFVIVPVAEIAIPKPLEKPIFVLAVLVLVSSEKLFPG